MLEALYGVIRTTRTDIDQVARVEAGGVPEVGCRLGDLSRGFSIAVLRRHDHHLKGDEVLGEVAKEQTHEGLGRISAWGEGRSVATHLGSASRSCGNEPNGVECELELGGEPAMRDQEEVGRGVE